MFEIPKDSRLVGNKVRLRTKKLSDARNDYRWQSDPQLARLDAAPLLSVSFPAYLMDYVDQMHKPGLKTCSFAIETADGRHIGNCTCYDIDDAKGEVQLGIMIGDRSYWDKGYGTDAVITIVNHIFSNTKLGRIHLKTLDWNLRAQECFKRSRFTPCGLLHQNGKNFVVMELRREQWEKNRTQGEAAG